MLRRGGSALPDVELVHRGVSVDRAHLARYDRVCGLRLGDTLPATYPHVLAFPLAMRLMSDGDFPLPMIGLVHVSNRITVRAPIDAGARLDLRVRAVDLRDHPRGRQFDMVATASVDDEVVWEDVSTYLRITSAGGGARDTGTGTGTGRNAGGGSARGSGNAPLGGAATRFPKPDVSGSSGGAVWRLPTRVGTDYAAVSGDRNPIHTSRLGARLFGFSRQIAHGMWTKARCLAALEGRLPDAYTVEVSFRQPILLPSTVRFTATLTGDDWDFAVVSKRTHLTGTITGG
nr:MULTISPECIES: MaoC/PaaZ C-terminal domain-containing protein [unclassified Actinoplanes]